MLTGVPPAYGKYQWPALYDDPDFDMDLSVHCPGVRLRWNDFRRREGNSARCPDCPLGQAVYGSPGRLQCPAGSGPDQHGIPVCYDLSLEPLRSSEMYKTHPTLVDDGFGSGFGSGDIYSMNTIMECLYTGMYRKTYDGMEFEDGYQEVPILYRIDHCGFFPVEQIQAPAWVCHGGGTPGCEHEGVKRRVQFCTWRFGRDPIGTKMLWKNVGSVLDEAAGNLVLSNKAKIYALLPPGRKNMYNPCGTGWGGEPEQCRYWLYLLREDFQAAYPGADDSNNGVEPFIGTGYYNALNQEGYIFPEKVRDFVRFGGMRNAGYHGYMTNQEKLDKWGSMFEGTVTDEHGRFAATWEDLQSDPCPPVDCDFEDYYGMMECDCVPMECQYGSDSSVKVDQYHRRRGAHKTCSLVFPDDSWSDHEEKVPVFVRENYYLQSTGEYSKIVDWALGRSWGDWGLGRGSGPSLR